MKSSVWFKTGLVIIGAGTIMTLSCSKKPEDPAWFQSTTTGKSLDKSALLNQIAQTDDIFTIYRMKDEYRRRWGKSQDVADALEEQWKKILKKNPLPGEICPEADLIAFNFKAVGPDQYRADFLFRTKQVFDKNYRIALHGIVNEKNRRFLSEERRKMGKKNEKWAFQPNPPTTAWPVGEDILLSHVFPAQPIPYKMFMLLYDRAGLHGNHVPLGWNTGLTEEDLFPLIESSKTLIPLFRLKTENQILVNKSKKIQKAFKKRSRQLLKGKKPLGPICPEADLIAFDYKKVGPKQYRVDYLFKVNHLFDKDYSIALYGILDKNNLDLLSEARRKRGKKSESWTFHPAPPTSHWPVGKYILISQLIHAQPIPYKMNTIFFEPHKKAGLHGQEVKLGWRVDLGE